jgi:hypothetical protein
MWNKVFLEVKYPVQVSIKADLVDGRQLVWSVHLSPE